MARRQLFNAGRLPVATTTHMPGGGTLLNTHWKAAPAGGSGGGGSGTPWVGTRWHRVFGYEAEGHSVAIPYTDAQLDSWAGDFDDIVWQQGHGPQEEPRAPHLTPAGAARMRAVNPDIRHLIYVNGGLLAKTTTLIAYPVGTLAVGDTIPEAWYAHDSAGARVGSTYGGSSNRWLMEPSNADWRAYVSLICRAAYDLSDYDGVFPDVLGLPSNLFNNAVPVNPTTGVNYTTANFMLQTRKTAAAIQAALPARAIVVPNGLKFGTPYAASTHVLLEGEGAVCAGGMAEQFSHDPTNLVLRSQASDLADLAMCDDVAAKGKYLIAVVKIWPPQTADVARLQFGFGLSMLGQPIPAPGARAKNTCLVSFGQSTDMDVYTWLSRTNYGKPTGPRVTVISGVFTRTFDFYTLAVNTTTASWSGTVNGQPVTLAPSTAQWVAV